MTQVSEEISVSYNSQPEGSPTEYLGAEISIGYLPAEKINQLKSQLESNTLFEEMQGFWGGKFEGSPLLQDFMDIHDIYHKNGLVYYEDICECARINEIVNGIGGKTVIIIRYNPDIVKNKGKIVNIPQCERINLLVKTIKDEIII